MQVDLKCTKPVNGKYYYSEHLPKLGEFPTTAVLGEFVDVLCDSPSGKTLTNKSVPPGLYFSGFTICLRVYARSSSVLLWCRKMFVFSSDKS